MGILSWLRYTANTDSREHTSFDLKYSFCQRARAYRQRDLGSLLLAVKALCPASANTDNTLGRARRYHTPSGHQLHRWPPGKNGFKCHSFSNNAEVQKPEFPKVHETQEKSGTSNTSVMCNTFFLLFCWSLVRIFHRWRNAEERTHRQCFAITLKLPAGWLPFTGPKRPKWVFIRQRSPPPRAPGIIPDPPRHLPLLSISHQPPHLSQPTHRSQRANYPTKAY